MMRRKAKIKHLLPLPISLLAFTLLQDKGEYRKKTSKNIAISARLLRISRKKVSDILIHKSKGCDQHILLYHYIIIAQLWLTSHQRSTVGLIQELLVPAEKFSVRMPTRLELATPRL